MCANYTTSTQTAWEAAFRTAFPVGEFKRESFPGYTAPALVNEHSDAGVLLHWGKPELVRCTFTARSETASTKPNFRGYLPSTSAGNP